MSTREIDSILATESVELLEAMQRGESGAAERLAKWIKQSRRHAEHYLMTAAFERELDGMQFDPLLEIAAPSSSVNVVPLHASQLPSLLHANSKGKAVNRPAFHRWFAAALVAVIAATGVFYWQAQRHEYVTTVGEQRVIELADGSIVHLNTQSRVEVRFSDLTRDIRLIAGEALFKVHQDPARPFRVHTVDAIIQAIGTEFNVHHKPEGTTVAVLEGKVKVTGSNEASLVRGEEARISTQGKIVTDKPADIASVTAWRQRRLIFAGTPLPQIVAEFNRYNRTPQLTLEGNNVSARVFSGVFDADDPESLMELLRREPGIKLIKEEDRIVVKVQE